MKKNKRILGVVILIVAVLVLAATTVVLLINLQNANKNKQNDNIVSFKYEYGSFSAGYYLFNIETKDNEVTFTASGENGVKLNIQRQLSKEELQKLSKIINENNIRNWDNFNGTNNSIMDGYSFDLHIVYEDGATVNAYGYHTYPRNYEKGHQALSDYLLSIK